LRTAAAPGTAIAGPTCPRDEGQSASSAGGLCAEAGLTAPYQEQRDPLDRILGYLDFRKALLTREVAHFSSLAGTMAQEVYATDTERGEAYAAAIGGHAAMLEADIAEAMKLYGVRAKWSAQSLANYVQSVLQGASILAKGRPAGAAASIDHLGRHIELLFKPGTGRTRRPTGP
jgi:TetR/AcrR family transcriptional regulator, transcriptional repressor for nem operon